METQIYYIRSIAVQNLIMGIVTALIFVLLAISLWRRKRRHTIALVIWAAITLWFFNSPLWGFSAVTVSPVGLEIDHGFLSVFKNSRLPPDTNWKIHVYMGGIRRIKKLYYLELAGLKSLKVRGHDRLLVVQSIGAAVDRLNNRPMGAMEDRPVNL